MVRLRACACWVRNCAIYNSCILGTSTTQCSLRVPQTRYVSLFSSSNTFLSRAVFRDTNHAFLFRANPNHPFHLLLTQPTHTFLYLLLTLLTHTFLYLLLTLPTHAFLSVCCDECSSRQSRDKIAKQVLQDMNRFVRVYCHDRAVYTVSPEHCVP